MFHNKYRLRKTTEIAKIFKLGQYVHGKYVFIKYLRNNTNQPQIAISVSTKLFKQATSRNRLKRIIRESIKPHLNKLPGINILIISKKELTKKTTLQELKKDISLILQKI